MGALAPRNEKIKLVVPAVAAGSDGVVVLGKAPFAGVVTAITFIAAGLLTGADTNSRTVSVVNKGQNGAGATVIGSKAFIATKNAPAFDETEITLSVTAANRNVAEGDVLAYTSTRVGTGLADPGGFVEITIKRTS